MKRIRRTASKDWFWLFIVGIVLVLGDWQRRSGEEVFFKNKVVRENRPIAAAVLPVGARRSR